MKYRTMGTDPKTRREVSVLALGTHLFGTVTSEATSLALLDRYVEAGGTFVDTAGNYAFWVNGTQGAHIDDPAVPLSQTVEAFAALVAEGTVGLLGASNHWAWRVERARTLAAAAGLPGYEVLEYQYSYLRPRTDLPGARSPDGMQGMLGGDLLSYLRAEPQLTAVAYTSLMRGGYVRPEKLQAAEFAEYDHPGTPARLAALREVAKDAGATVNQVVLAWLIGAQIPVIPVIGASSVTQLDENLAAADLELTAEQRARLNAAR
jgi:aryl-alcohol dehydrogenase-like predicted oxidoreductase